MNYKYNKGDILLDEYRSERKVLVAFDGVVILSYPDKLDVVGETLTYEEIRARGYILEEKEYTPEEVDRFTTIRLKDGTAFAVVEL